jgi:starch-binding outer membrane protein, SusD/RagB family
MKKPNMKKLIIMVVVMVFTTACDDFLDAPPKSALEESVIFSSYDLAIGAVDGIKLSFGETNSYRGRLLPWYGMNTDIEWYNTSQTAGANSDLAVYNALPNNTNMNTLDNAWAKMYEGIERANLCIRGLRAYGNPLPETDMGQLLGEALTLRAVFYADLLKIWGDVPFRFEPISTETAYLPKTSRDEIYKQLIADLGEAAELTPWPNASPATSTVERVSKAFVKGLRARLCLAASGYSQYPDGIRRSTDPDLSVANMYAIAKQECLDVINSGKVHLESSFETLWKNYNRDVVSAGNESLWEIPFSDGRGRMLFTFAVRHNSIDQHHANGANRGGQAGPLPHVFYDFDEKDTRRNVTCVLYRYGTANSTTKGSRQELVGLNTWYFGKFRYEWMNRYVTSTNDDGINKIYMRYAEILLMAAETINELDGPAAAASYLKAIRQRAFNSSEWATKVDDYVDSKSTKETMFEAIVDEHKFEFCGEMERKQALIRWNLLKTNMDVAKAKMLDLRNRAGVYADVPATLYYKYVSDVSPLNITNKAEWANYETLVIYGLNRTENINPGAGYTAFAWSDLVDAKINSLYTNDPNTKQYWPIWQVFIDSSNGSLVNDYGY